MGNQSDVDRTFDLAEAALLVRQAIDQSPDADARRVDVTTAGDAVVVRGRVASTQDAARILTIARGAAGGAVVDRLEVDASIGTPVLGRGGDTPGAGPAGEPPAGDEIVLPAPDAPGLAHDG